jgi:hypothetical protein
MLRRCHDTVRGLRNRRAATSGLEYAAHLGVHGRVVEETPAATEAAEVASEPGEVAGEGGVPGGGGLVVGGGAAEPGGAAPVGGMECCGRELSIE